MPKKRIFKTKNFNKWMRKTDLKDQDLLFAVAEMEAGLIDLWIRVDGAYRLAELGDEDLLGLIHREGHA